LARGFREKPHPPWQARVVVGVGAGDSPAALDLRPAGESPATTLARRLRELAYNRRGRNLYGDIQ